MKRYAIMVTGTRAESAKAKRQVERVLRDFAGEAYVVLIHGRATGVDRYAADYGKRQGWHVYPLPYFSDHGKAGGPKRNNCAVDLLDVLRSHGFLCFTSAFPDDDSRGTWQCVAAMQKKDFHPDVYELGARP